MTADRPIDEQRLAQFRRLLSDRGIETLACPACSERDAWGGFADAGVHVLTNRSTGKPTVVGSAHALLAVCGRCGYMVMFDRDVIGE